MKTIRFFLLLFATGILSVSAVAQSTQRMEVTIVNKGSESITKVFVMTVPIMEDPKRFGDIKLDSPIKPGGSRTLKFDAPKPEMMTVGKNTYPRLRPGLEIRWAEPACKTLLELNSYSLNQSVSTGVTECAVYRTESALVEYALADAEKSFAARTYQKAVEQYSNVLEKDPRNEKALHHRAHSYQNLKEYDKAIADFTATIAVVTNSKHTHLKPTHIYGDRALTYLQHEKFEAALADYNRVLAVAPETASFRYYRSQVYCKMGKKDLAAADEKTLVAAGITLPKTCL